MKNKYNWLVAILVIVCIGNAWWRLYKTYHQLFDKPQQCMVK